MSRNPTGFGWAEDPDFLWVAAGQFLLALGVREETVRPLGELRPLYERWGTYLGGGPDGGRRDPTTDIFGDETPAADIPVPPGAR